LVSFLKYDFFKAGASGLMQLPLSLLNFIHFQIMYLPEWAVELVVFYLFPQKNALDAFIFT